ncbi:MAG: hypothetical protein ABFS21_12865 [Actinomycetota bacterium]
MTSHDDVLTLVRNANPLPDLERFDADEAAAGVAAIEMAWKAERTGLTPPPSPVEPPRRTLRYTLVFVAAALIALILIGAPLLLRQPEDAPVIEEPTTTIGTTTTAPLPSTSTTLVPSDEAAPAPSGVVTVEFEGLPGHFGDGLSGLLQADDPDSDIDPSTGLLSDNVAAFAVEIDSDPFSTSQVLRHITTGDDEYAFNEPSRYLGGEAAIPPGVYRLTVWASPDYCCFLYDAPPETPAQRCQMWVAITGDEQTIHVKNLGLPGTHCNPDEPLQPLP